ncbi:MAG: hypothetical protein BWK79_06035 [Beggiatoa sp. IS2]|nr:MAG: hypothetical protein BWK79_06035 [Beggiatoa sp. IS2]
MNIIPDFDNSELSTIRAILKARYRRDLDIQLADSELRLQPTDRELTWCPTVFWQVLPVSFVVCKTAPERYRCQFFYSANEQYGTGIEEYTILASCVTTLLQMQADHASRDQETNV